MLFAYRTDYKSSLLSSLFIGELQEKYQIIRQPESAHLEKQASRFRLRSQASAGDLDEATQNAKGTQTFYLYKSLN